MNVAAIILAAGASSRFEYGNKLIAEIDGVPIVRHVASALAKSDVQDIVLVTADVSGVVARAAGTGRWRTVENPHADCGLSSSLRTGLQNIDARADGVLIALADMPGITANLINLLLAAFAETKNKIVFPITEDGRRGHPIIWPRRFFSALESLSGDSGGKAIIAAHAESWQPVLYDGEGAFADIDTRKDLDAFRDH
jgi:molybdenum cofactor cytidylyltransferase